MEEPLLVNEDDGEYPKSRKPCSFTLCERFGSVGLLLWKNYLQKSRNKCECCLSFIAAPLILLAMIPIKQSATVQQVGVKYGGLVTDSVYWFPGQPDFISLNDPLGYQVEGIYQKDADDDGWGQTNRYSFSECPTDDQEAVLDWFNTCFSEDNGPGSATYTCPSNCKQKTTDAASSITACADNYLRYNLTCGSYAECNAYGATTVTGSDRYFFADELVTEQVISSCGGPNNVILQSKSYYSQWFQRQFRINGTIVPCNNGLAQCVDPVAVLGWTLCRDGIVDGDTYDQPKFFGVVSNDGNADAILAQMQDEWNYFKGFYTIEALKSGGMQCLLDEVGQNMDSGPANDTFLPFDWLYKKFTSDDSMDDYVTNSDYGYPSWTNSPSDNHRPISVGFSVGGNSNGNGFQYSIKVRANDTWQPSTNSHDHMIGINYATKNLEDRRSTTREFEASGFIPVMVWVGNIITALASKQSPTAGLERITFGVHEVPQPEYTYDSFMSTFGWAMPMIFGIAFMYPFAKIVAELVEEKAAKLTEGLRMMGSTTSVYWISWTLYYVLAFGALSLILTLETKAFQFFQYSNGGLIFLVFFGFLMQMVTFGYLLSTIFDNPKIAGMMSSFVFLMTSFLFTGYSTGYSPAAVKGLSIIGNTAFGFLITITAQWEAGQFGLTGDSITMDYNGANARFLLIMLYLDGFIYFVLALYFEKVWPFTRFGQRMKPWYFVDPNFWCAGKKETARFEDLDWDSNDNFESTASFLGEPVVRIRGLVRRFGDFVAVNGTNLDLYEGECFCLLGHNGAGKTTTISMLTGLIDTTEGDCTMNNYSVNNQMSEIRKFMGVCPQHDVLFSRLTAIEHLRLFAGLKGVPPAEMEERCMRMLVDVGLAEKVYNFPDQMSGGQRRKLSLGIALIGGSKVVFLDEPTSGMDPESRRAVWNLIEREKRGRVIVLTTHFMDEADELGDRIAIMVAGNIRCCGSSTFLKQRYGVGYSFVVSCTEKPEKVKDEIFGVITRHLDPDSNPEEATCAGTEIAYRLPYSQAKHFPNLFDELDKRKEELCVDTYGISVTTLEEVFMRVGHMEDEDVEKSLVRKSTRMSVLTDEKYKKVDSSENRQSAKKMRMSHRSKSSANLQESGTIATSGLFLTHIYAQIIKKFHWTKRDTQLWICSTLIPAMILVVFLTIQLKLNYYGNAPELVLLPGEGVYVIADQGGQTGVYNVNPDNKVYEKIGQPGVEALLSGQYAKSVGYSASKSTHGIDFQTDEYWGNGTYLREWKTQLKDFTWDNLENPMYTSLYFDSEDPYSIGVGTNLSSWQGITGAMSLYANSLLSYINTDYAVVYTNAPLPQTDRENNLNTQTQAFMIAIYMVWGFSIAPGVVTFNVCRERQRQTKHQQLVSGVTIHSYWAVNLFWDFIWLTLTTTIIIATAACFKPPGFGGVNLFAAWLLGVVWGFAMVPFCFIFSFLVTNPSSAMSLVIGLSLIGGTALVLMHFFFHYIIASLKSADDILVNFYRIIPIFPLGDGLLNIALKGIFNGILFDSTGEPSVWAWEITGQNFVILVCEGVGYWLCVLLYEYLQSNNLLSFLEYSYPREQYPLDTDVKLEQDKIKSANERDFTEEHPIVIKGLRKCFKGKIAVRDLYYCVEDGECFGFLGVNGAGKTTSLNMLSGKFAPTEGTAFINGYPISDQLSCRRQIGYCPQFDALFDYLTAEEHLWFYARVKGMQDVFIEGEVNRLIQKLGLSKYRHKCSMTYSGGNKRKLSVGVALIGSPPIVFMDEPSTGMDPGARRDMWEFISDTMTGRSVILTTHSMEECEALCHRIGIMVAGQLECIGTATHLKNKFGSGYQVDVTYHKVEKGAEQWAEVATSMGETCRMNQLQKAGTDSLMKEAMFTKVEVLECHESAKYAVSVPKGTSLADLFRCLEMWKESNNVKNYSVSQTSLEQIFIQMAKKGEAERSLKPLTDGGYGGGTTGYSQLPDEVHLVTRGSIN